MNDKYSELELRENHFGKYFHDKEVQQKISKLRIDMMEIYPEEKSGSIIMTKSGKIDNHDGTFGKSSESYSVRYQLFDLTAAITWMYQNDWTVRSWLFDEAKQEFIFPPHNFVKMLVCQPLMQTIVYPGIRAWRDKPYPVRSSWQIKEIREMLKRNKIRFFMENGTESEQINQDAEILKKFFDTYSFNFALDCFDFLPVPR